MMTVYTVNEDGAGGKYITIPLGKFSDELSLLSLSKAYGFDLNKAWIDWSVGYYGDATELYINWTE